MQEAITNADLTIRTKVWNDKKVEAHHAIIPTLRKADTARLSKNEFAVYSTEATQYLAQFYPNYRYAELQIDVDIAEGKFIAKANQMLAEGWKQLFKNNQTANTEESEPLLTKLVKKVNKHYVLMLNSLVKKHRRQNRLLMRHYYLR